MLDRIEVRDLELAHPLVKMTTAHMSSQYIPKVTWDVDKGRFVPRSVEEITQLLRETTIGSWIPAKKDLPTIVDFLREVGCNLTDYRLKGIPSGTILRNEPPDTGTEIHQDNTNELGLTTIVYLENTCRGGALKFYEEKDGKNYFSLSTRPQIPGTCRVVTFPSKLWHRGMPISRAPGDGVQAKNACVLLSFFERNVAPVSA